MTLFVLLASCLRLVTAIDLAVCTFVGVALRRLPQSLSGYSGWLAGVPHWPAHRDMQADSLVKTLGFVMFPWVALVPVALAQLFGGHRITIVCGKREIG